MAGSKENSRESQESPVVALACDVGVTTIFPRGKKYVQITINSKGQFSEIELTERQYLHKMIRMAQNFIDPQTPRDNARLYVGTKKVLGEIINDYFVGEYSK